jgi:hypothetical protein
VKKLKTFELKNDRKVFGPVGEPSVNKGADLIRRAVFGC